MQSSSRRRVLALPTQLTLRNGLWNAGANALNALVGMLSSVIVVRSLSPEAYGTLSYYLWLASVMGTLGTLALSPALTKVSSELLGQHRAQDAEALGARVWQFALVLNGVITLGLAAAWLRGPNNPYLLLVAAAQLPLALASVASAQLWGRQDYRPVALWTSAAALLQAALVALAGALGRGGPGFAAAILGSGAVLWLGLTAHLYRTRGGRRPRASLPRGVALQYAAFLFPATLSRLIEVIVWQRSELFLLSRLSTQAQIGFYSLAYTVYGIFLSVGWALVNSYYPAISHLHGAGQVRAIEHRLQQGVVLAVLYSAPVGFGAAVTLPGLIHLLYGDKMLPTVAAGQVLLLGLVPGVLCAMMGLTVSATGRVWFSVALGLAMAAVDIGLAVWLIPTRGALGAAVASTAAQAVCFLGLAFIVTRVCRLRIAWRQPALLLLLAGATTLALPLLLQRVLPGPEVLKLLLVGLIGGGCYLAATWRAGYLRLLRSPGEAA